MGAVLSKSSPEEEMLSVVLARHRWETPSEELSSVAGQKPAKLVAHNLTLSQSHTLLKETGAGVAEKYLRSHFNSQ